MTKKHLTGEEQQSLEESARIINKEMRREAYLQKDTQRIMKLPNYVWEDLKEYLQEKHDLSVPKQRFSFSHFLYKSNKFRFEEFVNNIALTKVRVMFSMCARRLGIGLLYINDTYQFLPLEHLTQEGIEDLFAAYQASERFDIVLGDQTDGPETDDVVQLTEDE